MERLQGGTGMKKKLVGVLLTAAMAVSALAGCGSKQAAAPAESKAAEEKTLKTPSNSKAETSPSIPRSYTRIPPGQPP